MLALVGAVVLSAGGCGCGAVVVGDSLVANAAVADGATPGGWGTATSSKDGVTLRAYPGGAPCDYISEMQTDLQTYRPRRISLAWSGDNGTRCMLQAGQRLSGAALVQKYRVDLVTVTRFFSDRGVGVVYSAPLCGPADAAALRVMEQTLAGQLAGQGEHVAYSESAALQICPNWTYHQPYRSADGVHLSPTGAKVYAKALRREVKRTRVP